MLKVAVFTAGRFHLCDLARELDALAHEVAFHSSVPQARLQKFGLPDRCGRSMFWALAPFFYMMRKTRNTRAEEMFEAVFIAALENIGARMIGPCDVFIGISGMSTLTARAAKEKYGAQIWIERGSRHILSQRQILAKMPGGRRAAISNRAVERELAAYDVADVIVVPSRHAEVSFLDQGVPKSKLFRNPYGVDLDMFAPTARRPSDGPTVLFVGTWSFRKGCDLLWEACKRSGSWRLLHVGPIGDAPLPNSPLFQHKPAVPQWRLTEEFAKADVFALASREEGLSLVQAQALSSGLPVVCTDRTGGEDLRELISEPAWITVVPHDNVEALAAAIDRALSLSVKQVGSRDILGRDRDMLSWKAYGSRYSAELMRRASKGR